MRYFVTIGGRTVQVDLGPEGVVLDGERVDVDMGSVPGSALRSLLLDGRSHRFLARRKGRGAWRLHVDGRSLGAEVVDERTRAIREMTGAGGGARGPRPVRAPMPGLLVRVEVEVGDEVEAGQGLAIVEAMKMENELRAEAPGRVSSVRASPGDTVEKDQILIELAALDGDG